MAVAPYREAWPRAVWVAHRPFDWEPEDTAPGDKGLGDKVPEDKVHGDRAFDCSGTGEDTRAAFAVEAGMWVEADIRVEVAPDALAGRPPVEGEAD